MERLQSRKPEAYRDEVIEDLPDKPFDDPNLSATDLNPKTGLHAETWGGIEWKTSARDDAESRLLAKLRELKQKEG